MPTLFNFLNSSLIFKIASDFLLKIDRRRNIPRLAPMTFNKMFKQSKLKSKVAVFFNDTFTNYNHPNVGKSAVKILEALDYEVRLVDKKCCGRPLISKGLLESAKKNAKYNINSIYEYVKDGAIVVGVEPSCISALKDEYPDMFPEDKRTNLIAESTYLLQELIVKESKGKKFNFKKSDENKSYAVQVHCHEKTIIGENISIESLKLIPKSQVKKIPSGCCGMAGAFGYEKEHYDISKKIAEDRLLPYIEKLDNQTQVAITGVSCRHQIEDLSEKTPKHILEIFAENIV